MSRTLIGNTFPMGLIARTVRIMPSSREALVRTVADTTVFSFWGHAESLAAVSDFLGFSVTPRAPRPALQLDRGGWPTLHGVRFRECWVVTPKPVPGLRPANVDSPAQAPTNQWSVLRMQWV